MSYDYDVILLEGLSDESFLIEFLNQRYEIRYGNPIGPAIRYNKSLTIKNYDKNFLTKLSGSKTQVFDDARLIARDSSNGMIPRINKIGIVTDYDDKELHEIVNSYYDSLNSKYPGDVEKTDFGLVLMGKEIHILCIGNKAYCHMCDHWTHTLEDIIIEVIAEEGNDLNDPYSNIVIDAINKGEDMNYKTCNKSPINITMAFSNTQNSLAGFYKMIVSKNMGKITEILTKLETFITS